MDGYVTIGIDMETKSFDAQIKATENKLNDLISDYETMSKEKSFKKQSNEAIELRKEIEKTNNQLIDLIANQEDLFDNEPKKGKKNFEDIGKTINGITKKIVRWGLALFSIRSVYSLIRNSVSTLSQHNEKLAKDIEYIRYVIANTLAPVVEFIVGLVYKLLGLVQALGEAIFGYNIFSKASAKNMSSMAKSAKQIEKSLSKFDEADVFTMASPGGSGISATPSYDLSKTNLFANWDLEDFIDKGKEIASKIAKGISNFFRDTNWSLVADYISKGISGFINWVDILVSETDWKAVGKGIADFILNIDWLRLGEDILKLIIDGLEASLNLMEGITTGIIDKFTDPQFYKELIKTGKKMIEKIGEGMLELDVSMQKVWSKIISFFLGKLGIEDSEADKVGNQIGNGIMNGLDTVIGGLPFYGTFYKIIKLAKNVFGIHSPSTEFKSIGEDLMEGLKNGVKSGINGVIDVINWLIKKINSALTFKWNDITIAGVKLLSAGSISVGKIPTIPRLKKGAIANLPGRGIPTPSGGGNWAEAGREGYLPLTDSQVMSTLGQEIGKNVSVVATVPVYIGNRLVAKEMRTINAENNFAYNR